MPEIVGTPTAAVSKQADPTFNVPRGSLVRLQVKYPLKAPLEQIEPDCTCIFDELNDAVGACAEAQEVFIRMSLAMRCKMLEEIRKAVMDFRKDLAWCAWSETGLGRYEDKIQKMILVAQNTPGPEELVPQTCTGDHGLTTTDFAPMGLVAALTPVTNPTATVVNNAISLLSAGNSVVVHAHPSAAKCSNRAVAVVNQAIVRAGGPNNLVVGIRNPTRESAQALMKHPLVATNLVTGGAGAVEAALLSGKRSVCAGPANPPAVIDETASIEIAAKGIHGAITFDNGMNCSDPKEVFVVESVKEQFIEALKARGAVELTASQIEELMPKLLIDEKSHEVTNPELIGHEAKDIAALIGVEVDANCRLLICQCDASHPLVMSEQLLPVLPIVTCADFETAVMLAKKAEQDRRHSSAIYSQNLGRITAMGAYLDTALFTVNGSRTAGLGVDGTAITSFSIANITGEGVTRPDTFIRERRLVCCNALRYV